MIAVTITFPLDPFRSFVNGETSSAWQASLSALSGRLFLSLFALEIIILAVQAILFKDSIVDFIRSFGSKVILATVAIAVIGNAGVIFPSIVNIFGQTATTVVACPDGTESCVTAANTKNAARLTQCKQAHRYTCLPPAESTQSADVCSDLQEKFLCWAVTYFSAADASRVSDAAVSTSLGWLAGTPIPPDPGNGDYGLPLALLMGHTQFQIVCMALGMMCVMSAAMLLITYLLLTFEAQIVLAIGVFCLAGFGSRYTSQFAAGFPKYCVTIGIKFFTYYFLAAAIKVICDSTNADGMLAGLIGGATVPFGAGAVIFLMATSSAPLVALISSILIYAIPQFAASLTSGSPALSASDVYGRCAAGYKQGKSLNE